MTQAKTKKVEVMDVVKEVEPRETIEAIRNTKNPLVIGTDKQWPNMYVINRSEGGPPPAELKGMFTSHAFATQALSKHLG